MMKPFFKSEPSAGSLIKHPLKSRSRLCAAMLLAFACGSMTIAPAQATGASPFQFDMVRSPGIVNAGCLPNASAKVTIDPRGPVEVMTVHATGLPPNTDFDFFVIQVPNAPFGLSWYQGDIESDGNGNATGKFIGRFNVETFIVAPGVAPAPFVFNNAFPDATANPQTGPVHTYHLGLWFNSPKDASANGCPGTVTPFNGEHNAGVQVLNTGQFPETEGPLFQVKP